MLLTKTLAASLVMAACSIAATSASAQTYFLDASQFNYMSADKIQGYIKTDKVGTFTTKEAVEEVLQQTSFGFKIMDGASVLSELTVLNSAWELDLRSIMGVSLVISDSEFSLSFVTPQEFSSARLLLISDDGSTRLQFSQVNNISDYSIIHMSYNASHSASTNLPFGSTFVLSAALVPEPSSYVMLGLGLAFLGMTARRRS
ncbi:PEP-CTERM sorting domain-containing protein [Methylobacillus glycogenes]|uniref:PEP-CTERM sorting domain-containing protein n=1 Tax=Methylobacillus glycogenes TaxID=406 RepID=UPI00046FC6CB|nr:PEP-CTERM sorting domain-containing protein [Methylobacillus glycogenes]